MFPILLAGMVPGQPENPLGAVRNGVRSRHHPPPVSYTNMTLPKK